MNHWMFNCKEVTYMVSESMDRKLPFAQRMGIRMHLLMCRFCSRFRKQLLLLSKVSRIHEPHGEAIDPSEALSPEARSRIKQAMQQKQSSS